MKQPEAESALVTAVAAISLAPALAQDKKRYFDLFRKPPARSADNLSLETKTCLPRESRSAEQWFLDFWPGWARPSPLPSDGSVTGSTSLPKTGNRE